MLKKLVLAAWLLAIAACAWAAAQPSMPSAAVVAGMDCAQDAVQLVLVGGTGGSDAVFAFYARPAGGTWQKILEAGARVVWNGPGRMPAGLYRAAGAFGTASSPGGRILYVQTAAAASRHVLGAVPAGGSGPSIFLHCGGAGAHVLNGVAVQESVMRLFLTLARPDCPIAVAPIDELDGF